MNMTLKDNILFGAEYNADLYHQVLYACGQSTSNSIHPN